jgi:hypothetical protein
MTSTKSKPENWSMNTCKNGVTNTDHRYNYTNCTPLGIFFQTLFKYVKPSLVQHQKKGQIEHFTQKILVWTWWKTYHSKYQNQNTNVPLKR